MTLHILLELLLAGGVEGLEGYAFLSAGYVHSTDIVIYDDREFIPHGAGLTPHELVQIGTNHEVYSRLVKELQEMPVHPALEKEIGLVGMVYHRHVHQANLHRRGAELARTHCLAGPLQLGVHVVHEIIVPAICPGTLHVRLSPVKDDERRGAGPERIVERRGIGIGEYLGNGARPVSPALVVAAGKKDRDPGGEAAQRVKHIVRQRIGTIIPGTDDVPVQEKEIRGR